MRSTRADVRNPLLKITSSRQLGQWLDASTCFVLGRYFRDIAEEARGRAQVCWKTHKAPMALYWKVCAVYARHLAMLMLQIAREADREAVPGRLLIYRRALERIANRDPGQAAIDAQRALDQAEERLP